MSINAKVTTLRISPINTKCAYTFDSTITRDSVNNAVRIFTKPLAVGNNSVCRLNVLAEIVEKSSGNFTAFNADVTFTGGNVFVN